MNLELQIKVMELYFMSCVYLLLVCVVLLKVRMYGDLPFVGTRAALSNLSSCSGENASQTIQNIYFLCCFACILYVI